MRVLMLAALLAAASPAIAESLLRADNGEMVGWPAYDGEGKLTFIDCRGDAHPLAEGGSFEATEQRCPSEPAPFELTGMVAGVVPERSRLELREQGGATHMHYLGREAAEALAKLTPDQAVTVEGPVAGSAQSVKPAS
jgi:hypothetical protein